jgi:hypothetical protein
LIGHLNHNGRSVRRGKQFLGTFKHLEFRTLDVHFYEIHAVDTPVPEILVQRGYLDQDPLRFRKMSLELGPAEATGT